MSRFDHLIVLWQAPDDGTRCVIGDLRRSQDGGFSFAYREDLADAEARGFAELTEFPERRRYQSSYLFATFAQRIPSPRRPDFREIIESWGIEDADDRLEILARSGGIQMTDRLELAESRPSDDDLVTPLEFRIAGMRNYTGADRVKPGDRLAFRREPENKFDSNAAMVITLDGENVGHVPRQYSELVARQLDADHGLDVVAVRQLSVPADAGRWVVRVQRSA